jgi:thioredoxin 1
MVKELGTLQEYKSQIASAARNPHTTLHCVSLPTNPLAQPLVIIDFTATWCGPCKMVAPAYEKMSQEFPSVVFTKVDVDANEEAAAECGVQGVPTFQFYKGGQKVGEMQGVDSSKLRVSYIALQRVRDHFHFLIFRRR